MASKAEEIKAMKRTQPKMVMVMDALTGKKRMVVAEISEVEKERLAKGNS